MALALHYNWLNPATKELTLIDVKGGIALASVRATTARVEDWEKTLREVAANEPRFEGARRIEQLIQSSEDFSAYGTNGVTMTTNHGTNPINGETDTTLMTDTTDSGGHQIDRDESNLMATEHRYTMSCFLKRGTNQWGGVWFDAGGSIGKLFDLENGTVASNIGSAPEVSGIIDVGDGWYRCWITNTSNGSDDRFRIYTAAIDAFGYTGDGTGTTEIFGCMIEDVTGQADTAPSDYLPTAGGPVTKWYANKRRTNLSYSAADWVSFSSVRSDVTGGTIANPLTGAMDGATLSEDASASTTHLVQSSNNFVVRKQNQLYVMSCYFKPINRDWVVLRFKDTAAGNFQASFDVTNGTVGVVTAGATSGMESVGSDGWYRCWISIPSAFGPDTTSTRDTIMIAEADNDTSFTGLDQDAYYIYGLQVELGTTPTAYIGDGLTAALSSGFDTDLIPLGLLNEEARTNECLQSQNMETTWILGAATLAVVGNEIIAPDGTLTGDLIIDDSGGGGSSVNVYLNQNFTVATSTEYTFSVHCKQDQLDWVAFRTVNFTQPATDYSFFDLSDGVVGTKAATHSSSGVEDVGNGWFRCWITFTTDGADTAGGIRIQCADSDGDASVEDDGTSSIYAWGAQLEVGDQMTAYIPTTTGSVTRNTDSFIAVTDIDPSTGFTMYAHASRKASPPTTNDWAIFNLTDGGNSDYIQIDIQNDDTRALMTSGGAGQINIADSLNNWNNDDNDEKIVFGCDTDDGALWANGNEIGTDTTSVTLPAQNLVALELINTADNKWMNGHIKEIRYYDTRLPDVLLDLMSQGVFPVEAGGNNRRLNVIEQLQHYSR